MNLGKRDQKLIWHPFTQAKIAPMPLAIKRASGSYVYDEHGKAYLDLISSWWVNLHGHSHPKIARAIYEQASTLEHVIFAGFTHEPAIHLCEKLQRLLPSSFTRFFFSDNGSTAIESAIKMAYQYWWNQGQKQKKLFLSFDGSYHGDTFGAMSVGNSHFHRHYRQLFFDVINTPYPATWQDDKDIEEKEEVALKTLKEIIEKHAKYIAAFILEPLAQGVSGMRIVRASFVKRAVEIAKAHDILIIFDEVMTGFGRTGTTFAMDQVGFTPDFICLAKGLTGGFLPLALTITHEKIFEAFLGDCFTKALAHGHSYTANPIGCAAAIASLDLLGTSQTQESINMLAFEHKIGLKKLSEETKNTMRFRTLGTIAAFDITGKSVSQDLSTKFQKNGLLLRQLGNTIYLLPPYSVTREEIRKSYDKIAEICFEL